MVLQSSAHTRARARARGRSALLDFYDKGWLAHVCLESEVQSTSARSTMPKLMTTKDVDILEEAHRKEASCASWWQEQWKAEQVHVTCATLTHNAQDIDAPRQHETLPQVPDQH